MLVVTRSRSQLPGHQPSGYEPKRDIGRAQEQRSRPRTVAWCCLHTTAKNAPRLARQPTDDESAVAECDRAARLLSSPTSTESEDRVAAATGVSATQTRGGTLGDEQPRSMPPISGGDGRRDAPVPLETTVGCFLLQRLLIVMPPTLRAWNSFKIKYSRVAVRVDSQIEEMLRVESGGSRLSKHIPTCKISGIS
jgi:hypothetical protein